MLVTNRVMLMVILTLVFHTGIAMAQSKASVRVHDDAEHRGSVTIAMDGKEVLAFQYRGTGEEVDAGQFEFPVTAKKIQISGNISRTRGGRTLSSRGSATLSIVDLTPLVQTLRSQETWPQRLTLFLKQKADFDERLLEWAPDAQFEMSPGERANKAAIDSAVRRLGYALPAEHAQVLEQFGAWRLNDSFTTPVDKLQNALEQIVSLWEFPRESIESLPDESKALLRSSVILHTLVGDGYRAILYQPPAAGEKKAQGTFHISDEDSLGAIRALKTPDGNAMTYSQVITSVIAVEGLSCYGSTGEAVLVDRSGEFPPAYRLQVIPDGTSLRFALYWKPQLGR